MEGALYVDGMILLFVLVYIVELFTISKLVECMEQLENHWCQKSEKWHTRGQLIYRKMLWVLGISDGTVGESNGVDKTFIIPSDLLIPSSDDPFASIVDNTYSRLLENMSDVAYFIDRAILAPKNSVVEQINDYVLNLIPREEKTCMTSSIFSFKIVMTSLTRSNCVALRSATFVAADNRKITHICQYSSLLNHLCMFSVYTVDPTNNNFNCFFGIWVLFWNLGTFFSYWNSK